MTEIYASHVLEYMGFKHEMPAALTEFHRVLLPGGGLRIGVPDLAVLCALYVLCVLCVVCDVYFACVRVLCVCARA